MSDTPLTTAFVDALAVEYDGTDAFQNRSSLIKFAASLERDRAKLLASLVGMCEAVSKHYKTSWQRQRAIDEVLDAAQRVINDTK